MKRATLRARVVGSVSAVALVAGMTLAFTAGTASAASPSDDRADFHSGNVVNCGQIGLPNSTTAFANGTDSIDDGNVSGDVVGGTTVNVDNPPAGVVIQAVVVKGGPAYNVYSTSSGDDNGNHVPPAEATPTEYISPLNGGGNVPTVSHWFICYTSETPPDTGSLLVSKDLIDPTDTTAVVPTTFTFHVVCKDSGDVTDINVTFDLPIDPGDGGALEYEHVVTDIPDGDTCTVVETAGFLTGFEPTYLPVGADTTGVDIVGGEQSEVTVTNDFADVKGETVVVPVTPVTPAPAALPLVAAARFTG